MNLEIDVVFTAGHFHGEKWEWPPSPARLFQALIAATHRGLHGLIHQKPRDRALSWLETLAPPLILIPAASFTRFQLVNYVPNNDNNPTDHIRAAKQMGCHSFPQGSIATYRWKFIDHPESRQNAEVIAAMASLISYLGRTIDLVFARGRISEEAASGLPDNRQLHQPTIRDGGKWLSPAAGFLALCKRRYPHSVSQELPNFTNSRQVDYQTDAMAPFDIPMAVFEMIRENGRPLAFDPRRLREPAGMARHAMLRWAESSPLLSQHYGADRISRLVAGHKSPSSPQPSEGGHFAVVPLPSMNSTFTADGWMRRVAIIGYGCQDRRDFELFNDLINGLQGSPLRDNSEPLATLQIGSQKALRVWRDSAKRWRSITPVVLTGFTRRGRSPEMCIARSLMQQGIHEQDIESIACFSGPIAPKTLPALAYYVDPQSYLSRTPRYHLEIIFRRKVAGPLVVGRGRFAGFGLMLPVEE